MNKIDERKQKWIIWFFVLAIFSISLFLNLNKLGSYLPLIAIGMICLLIGMSTELYLRLQRHADRRAEKILYDMRVEEVIRNIQRSINKNNEYSIQYINILEGFIKNLDMNFDSLRKIESNINVQRIMQSKTMTVSEEILSKIKGDK